MSDQQPLRPPRAPLRERLSLPPAPAEADHEGDAAAILAELAAARRPLTWTELEARTRRSHAELNRAVESSPSLAVAFVPVGPAARRTYVQRTRHSPPPATYQDEPTEGAKRL